MSFISNIKNFIGSTAQKSFNSQVFGYLNNASRPRMGEKEYLKAYHGWVYACVNAIAEVVSQMDIVLEKKTKDGWTTVEKHQSTDVLNAVNNFYTFSQLLFSTQAFSELSGNAYWYCPSNSTGKTPKEIWPLDPTKVVIIKSKTDYIDHYEFTNGAGEVVRLETYEVIHFKDFNPEDALRGVGRVQAAAIAIDTDTFSAEWQRNFFGNSAMPSALLKVQGNLSQEQFERIKASWDSKFRGVQNSGKMAILEGGTEYQALSPTQKEMQYSESRKALRDEILAYFRVPKTILGITEDVNFASAQVTEYVFTKFVCKPKMQRIVDNLNEFYLPMFGLVNYDYRFRLLDPVPENREQQVAERASGIQNYYMTPNEAREQMGLEPIDGGDVLYIPTTVMPFGSSYEQPTEPTKSVKKKTFKHYKFPVNKSKQQARRAVYLNKQRVAMHDKFVEFNGQLKKTVLKNLKSKSGRANLVKARTDDVIAKSSFIDNLFKGWKALTVSLGAIIKVNQSEVMAHAGTEALVQVGVETEFDLANTRAANWLKDNALMNSTSYTGTVRDEITAIVESSIADDRSVDEITADLSQYFDDSSEYKAERLARTETIDAYNQGSLEGYIQSDVVVGKEWLTGGDACDDCQGNEDEGMIGLDEDFQSGDDAPTAHPNCECSLQPVTADDY